MNRYEEVIFFSKVAIEQVWRSDSEKMKRPRREEREFGVRKVKFWSLETVKDQKSKRRRGDRGVSIKDNINNINVRLGFMVQSWKSFLFSSILKLWEIFRKSIFKLWENFRKNKRNDMVADVAQLERSNIKCYASAFSNILII